MAKNRGVIGWYSMNKADLVENILALSTNSPTAHSLSTESGNQPTSLDKPTNLRKPASQNRSVAKNKPTNSDKSRKEEKKAAEPAPISSDHLVKKNKRVQKSDDCLKAENDVPASSFFDKSGHNSTPKNSSRLRLSATDSNSSLLSGATRPCANNANFSGTMTPQPGTPGTLGLPPLSSVKPIPRRANLVDLNSATSQRSTRDREFAGSMKEDQDRVVIMVRDAFWLHIHWNIRQRTRERVRASMGREWHSAKPVLRLYEVTSNNGLQSRRFIRNVNIKPRSGNWFIDINGVPACYQTEIGYLSEKGKFYSVLASNIVTTPEATTARGFGVNSFAESSDTSESAVSIAGIRVQKEMRPHDMQEELPRRLQTQPSTSNRYSLRAVNSTEFPFSIDAKVLLHGKTLPGAHITVRGYPVIVDEDGEFLMRMEMPDRRQVIPIVASSGDGTQQRTIVLSLERNTRILEPVFCDMEDNIQ